MLIDEPRVLDRADDPLRAVMEILSDGRKGAHVSTGVYEIPHFGHSNFLPGYFDGMYSRNPLPKLLDKNGEEFCRYGVCDAVQQIFDLCPTICESTDRQFVITVKPIFRGEEPASGGWRWHKWGPYIGIHIPQCEYIHDEPEISMVMVYHVYEKEPAL